MVCKPNVWYNTTCWFEHNRLRISLPIERPSHLVNLATDTHLTRATTPNIKSKIYIMGVLQTLHMKYIAWELHEMLDYIVRNMVLITSLLFSSLATIDDFHNWQQKTGTYKMCYIHIQKYGNTGWNSIIGITVYHDASRETSTTSTPLHMYWGLRGLSTAAMCIVQSQRYYQFELIRLSRAAVSAVDTMILKPATSVLSNQRPDWSRCNHELAWCVRLSYHVTWVVLCHTQQAKWWHMGYAWELEQWGIIIPTFSVEKYPPGLSGVNRHTARECSQAGAHRVDSI